MSKRIVIILSFFLLLNTCTERKNKNANPNGNASVSQSMLPRVLYITTGIDMNKTDKDLPSGINLALQFFNARGVPVYLSPRDILYDLDRLKTFGIIIISTGNGIHDADRKYSLTYMTDEEMQNLMEFVGSGGFLIAGDNTGRNTFDGKDRILDKGILDRTAYPLSELFGSRFKELNTNDFRVKGTSALPVSLQGTLTDTTENNRWMLVPEITDTARVNTLAYWKNKAQSHPAWLEARYGKGMAWLLPFSGWLTPVNDGGDWSLDRIEAFYGLALHKYKELHPSPFRLGVWPDGKKAALAVSFNPEGDMEQYRRILEALREKKVEPVFFVNGKMPEDIRAFLITSKSRLSSSGFDYIRYDQADYAVAVNDILRNEKYWNYDFNGFRFPFTSPAFFGFIALERHGYAYESGISVNNREFLHGSCVPYNIVVSKEGIYFDTHIYELSPTYHDDYFFLKHLGEEIYLSEEEQTKKIRLWNEYLQMHWKKVTLPYSGLMVYLGHPAYTGYDRNTLQPLLQLIDTARADGAWITDLDHISRYRDFINSCIVYVEQNGNDYRIRLAVDEERSVRGFTINLPFEPVNLSGHLTTPRVEPGEKGHFHLIFDARNGVEIKFSKK